MSMNLPPIVTAEFQARFQQPPGASSEKELARWQQLCREVIEEREKLRADLARLQTERDDYRRSLIAIFAKEDIPFTREEVFASLGERPTFHELIRELESQD
jgi:hypothetical protein